METENKAPELQIADLIFMLKLVQAMASRGAFKAEELSEVGSFHDKLVNFLTASGAMQPEVVSPVTEESTND
jgi:hypothetical protein